MKVSSESAVLALKIDKALTNMSNPSLVLKNKSATIDIFDKVACHPDIFPQISSYQSALCGVEVTVKADNKKIDEVLTSYLSRLGLRTIIPQAASARDYGYAVLEITEYGEQDGYIVPERIELCPHKYFFFDKERKLRLTSDTDQKGIDVMAVYPNKFIVLQSKDTLTNPYGIGLLDVAYWIAVGLNGNFEFLMQFVEDDGRDKWIGHYPVGSSQEQITELLNTMIQLRNNGVAAMPVGTDIEAKSMTGRSSTNNLYKDTDEMLRRKVEKMWTGTDLTMQVDGKGGYSSSTSGLSIRADALQEGITLVQSCVKQLIRIICSLNNLPEVPQATIQLPQELDETIAKIDKTYYDMGLKPTKELFIKRGYAESDFFIDETKKEGATADFAAIPAEMVPLLDAFERYSKRIKKKD